MEPLLQGLDDVKEGLILVAEDLRQCVGVRGDEGMAIQQGGCGRYPRPGLAQCVYHSADIEQRLSGKVDGPGLLYPIE